MPGVREAAEVNVEQEEKKEPANKQSLKLSYLRLPESISCLVGG